ncbi:MAG: hypothetical protein J0L55_02280 [Caulobacterales bacterium]|nr:hypothetical protein [Caulobacterales bacterium]MCA0372170.1 hypothetical protein [Pseudomonadota bacterium]
MGFIVEYGRHIDIEDVDIINIDEIRLLIEQNQSSINRVNNFFDNNSIHDVALPIDLLLEASHFYPACGDDTSPIAKMKKLTNSFVFSDFFFREAEMIKSLSEPHKIKMRSFQSHYPTYELHEHRTISIDELPNSNVIFGRTGKFLEMRGAIPKNKAKDFYTLEEIKAFPEIKTSFVNPFPFAHWFVFKYNKRYIDSKYINDTNPKYISLIHISGDAMCAYKGLYSDRKTAPTILTLLDCGSPILGNYMNLLGHRSNFSKIVLKSPIQPKVFNCLTEDFASSFISIKSKHKELGSYIFGDRDVTISAI